MKEIELPGKTLKLSKHGLSKPAPNWLLTTVLIILTGSVIIGIVLLIGEPLILESIVAWMSIFSLALIALFINKIRTPDGYRSTYHHYLNVHEGVLTLKLAWKEPQRFSLEKFEGYRESGPQIYLTIDGDQFDIKRGYLDTYQNFQDVKDWLDEIPKD